MIQNSSIAIKYNNYFFKLRYLVFKCMFSAEAVHTYEFLIDTPLIFENIYSKFI